MRVITAFGSFDVLATEAGPELLTIRSYSRAHLVQLRDRYLPELETPTQSDGQEDSSWQARVRRDDLARALGDMARSIDYAQFETGWRAGLDRPNASPLLSAGSTVPGGDIDRGRGPATTSRISDDSIERQALAALLRTRSALPPEGTLSPTDFLDACNARIFDAIRCVKYDGEEDISAAVRTALENASDGEGLQRLAELLVVEGSPPSPLKVRERALLRGLASLARRVSVQR